MSWLNKIVAQTLPAVPKPIVRRFSSRYIAGETLTEALATVESLNAEKMHVTLDILGEFVTSREEARKAGEEYLEALRAIHDRGLDSNVSLKLTQMGLKLDLDLCYRETLRVVEEAARLGNFVRLDMEDSTCTDDTLEIYRRLHRSHPRHVGCVIQAYLKRSEKDVQALVEMKANVRLCKGIYIEPPSIAWKAHDEINRSYKQLLWMLLAGGCYTGIATHDEELVDAGYDLVRELGLESRQYEFQMLLGVRETLRGSILDRGHRLRVYVPYGSHWYAYSLRRLKENPQIAGHVMRGIFNGK